MMPESNPPFVYRTSFEDWNSQNCGICGILLTSGLYIFGITTLEVERHCAYICDDCLLKMFAAIPASLALVDPDGTIGDFLKRADLASAG